MAEKITSKNTSLSEIIPTEKGGFLVKMAIRAILSRKTRSQNYPMACYQGPVVQN